MDLGEQEVIKKAVDANGKAGVVVILGSPSPESAEIFAETVAHGDPTWAGPLAGVPLGLPVYHVTEPEIRAVVNPDVYRDQVELMELALDTEAIWQSVADIRQRLGEA
jgi:glycine/sarcosine/betaine reductase complex component A